MRHTLNCDRVVFTKQPQ